MPADVFLQFVIFGILSPTLLRPFVALSLPIFSATSPYLQCISAYEFFLNNPFFNRNIEYKAFISITRPIHFNGKHYIISSQTTYSTKKFQVLETFTYKNYNILITEFPSGVPSVVFLSNLRTTYLQSYQHL